VELSRSKVLEAVSRLEEAGWLEIADDGDVVRRRQGPSLHEAIKTGTEASHGRSEFERSRLEMMRSYAETDGCRRNSCFAYFGEEHEGLCGRCDNCRAGVAREESAADHPFELGSSVIHGEWGPGEVQRYDENSERAC
jgi:ATP-dependent DNA helicase RecQ